MSFYGDINTGMKTRIIALTTVNEICSQKGVHIFDVNGFAEYQRRHLPKAVHLDLPFCSTLLPTDKEATIVFYSRNAKCAMAGIAAAHAKRLGYKNACQMKAGIEEWVRMNYLTETTIVRLRPRIRWAS